MRQRGRQRKTEGVLRQFLIEPVREESGISENWWFSNCPFFLLGLAWDCPLLSPSIYLALSWKPLFWAGPLQQPLASHCLPPICLVRIGRPDLFHEYLTLHCVVLWSIREPRTSVPQMKTGFKKKEQLSGLVNEVSLGLNGLLNITDVNCSISQTRFSLLTEVFPYYGDVISHMTSPL